MSHPRVVLTTVVWGEWHRRMFRDAMLPTLLAPCNLPALAAAHDCEWLIYTDDIYGIEHDPNIQLARRMAHVQIGRVDLPRDMGVGNSRFTVQQAHWHAAARHAEVTDSLLVFVPPDVIWSDGSLSYLSHLVVRGALAVSMNGPRVSDAVCAGLPKGSPGDSRISLTGRECVNHAMAHEHREAGAYMLDAESFSVWPEMIMQRIGDEGYLCRCMAHETLAYFPHRVGMGRSGMPKFPLGPGEFHIVSDSDDMVYLSLAKGSGTGQPTTGSPVSPVQVATWWRQVGGGAIARISRADMKWHRGEMTADAWQQASRNMDRFVDDCEAAARDPATPGRVLRKSA